MKWGKLFKATDDLETVGLKKCTLQWAPNSLFSSLLWSAASHDSGPLIKKVYKQWSHEGHPLLTPHHCENYTCASRCKELQVYKRSKHTPLMAHNYKVFLGFFISFKFSFLFDMGNFDLTLLPGFFEHFSNNVDVSTCCSWLFLTPLFPSSSAILCYIHLRMSLIFL